MKNIKDYNLEELKKELQSMDEKTFRAEQIFKWLYQDKVKSFDDMTNLSLELREKLKENYTICNFKILKKQESSDGTKKYLFDVLDGNAIETVLMSYHHGYSICVSSQIGCKMGCKFCASTGIKFVRSLTSGEIVEQILAVEQDENIRISNIVFMGMGEPLLNLTNVLKALEILSNENGINISKRKITISTSGIVPNIEKILLEKVPVELAISLHSAINEKRDEIIPINRRYPLEDLHAVLQEYQRQTKRRITFEYILINNFNVSEGDANALADFVHDFDHVVNLIPCNPVEGTEMTRPSDKKIERFVNFLQNVRKVNVTIRREKGTDIDGACGQLRQKNKKPTK